MTNIQAIDLLKGLEQSLDDYCELNDEGKTAFRMAITALELFGNSEQLPSAQPKKNGVIEQTKWERDVATEQLKKKLGYGLGEKIRAEKDCISRQAAIDAIRASTSKYTGFMEMEMYTDDDAVEAIKALPSAEPKRKTGRWLELTNTNHTYVCSVCGRMLVNITDGKNMVSKNYPFCHCGADMRGEDE